MDSITQQPTLLKAMITPKQHNQTTQAKHILEFKQWTVATGRPLLDNGEGKFTFDQIVKQN